MESVSYTYHEILQNLRDRKRFSFARYGDGEIKCIFHHPGGNIDHHKYFDDLGERLKEIILSQPKYMVGLQRLGMNDQYAEPFKQMIAPLNIRFVNADVLHRASITHELSYFLDALKDRYVVMVGPGYLSELSFIKSHIEIPKLNCWTEYEKVKYYLSMVLDLIDNAVVLLSASMMSEVLIDDFKDSYHTFIDTGAVLDPLAGQFTRSYHHKLTDK